MLGGEGMELYRGHSAVRQVQEFLGWCEQESEAVPSLKQSGRLLGVGDF